LVSHPFVLTMVTGLHGAVHPVRRVATCPGATVVVRLGCPAQLAVTVVVAVPPLSMSNWLREDAFRMPKGALVRPGPLKLTLLVANCA